MVKINKPREGGSNPSDESYSTGLERLRRNSLDSGDRAKIENAYAALEYTTQHMSPDCKAMICIPCHFNEPYVNKVIQRLGEQQNLEEFEVTILINGPEGVDLQNCQAINQINRALANAPNLRINIARVNFQDFKIGKARRMLAEIMARRTLDSGFNEEELGNMVMVTYDADHLNVDEERLSKIIAAFNEDPNIGAMAGLHDYPREDLVTDHILLATKRFTDFLETIYAYKDGHLTMRGGNTAFRFKNYVSHGAHSAKSIKGEHRTITRKLLEEGSAVFRPNTMQVSTSARRAKFIVEGGGSIAEQHAHFGSDIDVAFQHYLIDRSKLKLPNTAKKVTDESFGELLADQLNTLWQKIYDNNTDDRLEKQISYFEKAAFYLGIQIKWNEDFSEFTITNIKNFKNGVMEHYAVL